MNKEDLKREIGDLIWKMATNLVHGGKVSPVQFMDYTLGALFYRFISENITDYCNHLMTQAGVPNADYLHMSDAMAENARGQIVKAKGFFIKPSQLFQNVANGAKSNDQLNTTLANNFKAIEESAIGTDSEDAVLQSHILKLQLCKRRLSSRLQSTSKSVIQAGMLCRKS